MAFQLLERGRDNAKFLADTLHLAIQKIDHCERCRTFSETPLCSLCDSQNRKTDLLCIVESPSDILAIEQTACFRGLYFVLMGHLSPLDGIGPNDIGIPALSARFDTGELTEVILATNPTVEGEATAHYIAELLKAFPTIKASRIAHGVPLGGELEYIDSGTLAHALTSRELLASEN
jgi:recombination protein RecR